MLRRVDFWALVGLTILMTAGRVRADGLDGDAPDGDPSGYRQLVDDGLREYQAQNFAEARALFGRAHALLPSARTLRGLAMTDFELHRYADCIVHIESALSANVKPLTGALRDEALTLRTRAEHFVDRVSLQLTPNATRATLDGAPLPAGPQTLVLDVGDHQLELTAPGFVAERRALHATGGESRTLAIALAPLRSALQSSSPAPGPRDTAPAAQGWWRRRSWLWVALGTVAAAGGVTAGVLASRDGSSEAAPYAGNVPNAVGP